MDEWVRSNSFILCPPQTYHSQLCGAMIPRLILSILLLSISSSLTAQWTAPGFEGNVGRGFLLPHRQNMKHLPQGPAHFLEGRVYHAVNGSKPWHSLFPQAEVGFALRVFDLANVDVLGYGIGGAFYLSAPVVIKPKFQWNLELGAGPGIVTKPFNPSSNYKNVAIGSYGNVFIMLGQRFTYHINERLDVNLNLSFNHFSNAAFTLPNLGLNYPMISSGMGYRLPSNRPDTLFEVKAAEKVKNFWTVGINNGLKEYARPYKAKHPAFVALADYNVGLGRKSSLSLGADVMYNLALLKYRRAIGQEVTALENTQIGIRAGYNLHVEEMLIFFQIGGYVLDTYERDGWMYNRVGLRYFFTDSFGANLSLKTHKFKADYAEAGVSFRF